MVDFGTEEWAISRPRIFFIPRFGSGSGDDRVFLQALSTADEKVTQGGGHPLDESGVTATALSGLTLLWVRTEVCCILS